MSEDWGVVHKAWADPGPEGSNLKFQQFPAFFLMTLASLAKASVCRASLDPAGLSVPEWRLLTAVVGGEPVPFGQIAALTQMDKGQISRTLRTAQGKGLIHSEVMPLERRSPDAGVSSIGRVVVRITPAGQRLYERVMPAAQRSQLRLLELMSPEERRTLVDLSRRMHEHLTAEGG